MTLPRYNDLGFVAGGEALLFGVLTCVAGMLIAVNAWAVVDSVGAADAAAREGARAFVEAASSSEAYADAELAARNSVASTSSSSSIEIAVLNTAGGPAVLARCQRIVVEVSLEVDAISIPFIGDVGSRQVTGRHSELVDPWRSGLPATSLEGTDCDA